MFFPQHPLTPHLRDPTIEKTIKKLLKRPKSVFPAAPPTPHLRDPLGRGISVDGRSALPLAYPIILGVPVAIVTIVTIVTSITLVIDIIIVIICN